MQEYITISGDNTAEYEEKHSRFIATCFHCETEQEASEIIAAQKSKYWDARHNCSAFVIGAHQELTRCSDDGEPAQTAGRPMLSDTCHSERAEGVEESSLRRRILELMAKRAETYEKTAHIIIETDGKSIKDISQKISRLQKA